MLYNIMLYNMHTFGTTSCLLQQEINQITMSQKYKIHYQKTSFEMSLCRKAVCWYFSFSVTVALSVLLGQWNSGCNIKQGPSETTKTYFNSTYIFCNIVVKDVTDGTFPVNSSSVAFLHTRWVPFWANEQDYLCIRFSFICSICCLGKRLR